MKKNNKNAKPQKTEEHKEVKKTTKLTKHILYLLFLTFIFLIAQQKVFKENVDINGDNATYYMGAKAIHQGDGYANIMSPEKPKTNNFPPGYPFLMSLVMYISKSFVAQKIFNSILLFLSCILLYFLIFKVSTHRLLALASSILVATNHVILHYNSMMLSESSFIFFSLASILLVYKVYKLEKFKQIIRSPYFYLLIFTAVYAYHIRSQGISLIMAFLFFFLLKKKWKLSLSYLIGVGLLALPWIVRNKIAGIDSSRYLKQILAVNHWRPEQGLMSIEGVFKRVGETSQMLVSKAIPDSIIPAYTVNYKEPSTTLMWIIGILSIALIIYGIWKFFNKSRWFYLLYIIFTCGIITLWSAPSQNRYLATIAPFLQVGLLLGIIALILLILKRVKTRIVITVSVISLMLASTFYIKKDVMKLREINNRKLHPAYKNYFAMARYIHEKHPDGEVIVSSRKPSLFFLYSNCYNVGYKYSLNDTAVLENFIKKDVDYVVLEQLGYSSTTRYLYPTIKKNPYLFRTIVHKKNPDTYLLWFDKKRAMKKINYRKES